MQKSPAAKTLVVSTADRARLEALLAAAEAVADRDGGNLETLALELGRAQVVPPEDVPPDVVTLYSRVQIEDLDTHESRIYTLVLPWEADVHAGRLSVLAPIGTALLGYREGDRIEWPVPRGVRRIRVVRVLEQPELPGAGGRQARA